MRTNMDNIRGKNVLIVGLGRTGIATIETMLSLDAKVYVQDLKSEDTFEGNMLTYFRNKGVIFFFGSTPPDMTLFDMIILSPGVNPELEFVREGAENGAEITGELEIAYRISRGNFVAITGTNGKTTTTMLTGEIFEKSGRNTVVAGNIGTAVIPMAASADEDTWLITETSSFQLETTRYFKPAISALLNITPDHLDRHHTMDAYAAAKKKIFENQKRDGFLIVNYSDSLCMDLAKDAEAVVVPFSRTEELPFGVFVKNGNIVIRDRKNLGSHRDETLTKDDENVLICSVSDIQIIGDHNLENVLAAVAISYFAGINPEDIRKAISAFAGVPHRIEYCGEIAGVKYYNDSKGTNTDAAVTALKALEKNIILIAGGDGKGQDFFDFAKELKGRVKHLYLIGKDGKVIAEAADRAGFAEYTMCKDLPECIREAYSNSEEGDSVLLSPACASWDMYDNYEQRGNHFKECVNGLIKQ